MPAPKGRARPPGSGRKPGTPNKRTQDLMAIFEELKYDPAHAILDLLPQLEPDKQADIHMRLMKFKYPERKAIEHTGKDGGGIEHTVSDELMKHFLDIRAAIKGERK